jgi:predicted RNase H-like HicB family nuclease
MNNATVDKIITGQDLTFNLSFERDQESGWFTVHVVELPGCVSQGATIEEAKSNIANALELYMEVLLENAIRNQAAVKASVSVEPLSETAKMLVRPKFEVRA